MANLTRLSKFLALALRHKPERFGLILDSEGFADLGVVSSLVEKRFQGRYTHADLEAVVAGDRYGKKRYEIRGGRIRALFGHSDVQPIAYPSAVPPEILYHGTTPQAVSSIRKHGLKSQARQYVHLTTNVDHAGRVAKRRTKEIVLLVVRAREAHNTGLVFHHPEAEHYLVLEVPPKFIDFPD